MISRIATFVQSQTVTRELQRLQSQYADVSLQESSSLKSQNYQSVSDDSYSLVLLQSSYDVLAKRSENEQVALNKVNTVYSSISSIEDLVVDMQKKLSSVLSGGSESIESASSNSLSEMQNILNTRLAGDSVFSGSVTNTRPVDTSALPTYTAPTSANTSYYQGDSYIDSVRTGDTTSISYGVTADNEAFEKVIRAFKLISDNPTDTTSLKEAYSLLGESVTALGDLQTNVSGKATLLDNHISQDAEDLNTLDTMISNLNGSDITSLTVQINEMDTQLQAAYSISTKLLKMSLASYL